MLYWCNETKTRRTARRRSSWSPRRHHHQSLWQAKTTFVRIACTSCPFELARHCWLLSRSIFGKRTRANINRTSHHLSKGRIIQTILTHTSSPSSRTPQPQEVVLPLYFSSSAQEAIHHHHTGVGYYTTTLARTSINLVSFCVASSSSSSVRS